MENPTPARRARLAAVAVLLGALLACSSSYLGTAGVTVDSHGQVMLRAGARLSAGMPVTEEAATTNTLGFTLAGGPGLLLGRPRVLGMLWSDAGLRFNRVGRGRGAVGTDLAAGIHMGGWKGDGYLGPSLALGMGRVTRQIVVNDCEVPDSYTTLAGGAVAVTVAPPLPGERWRTLVHADGRLEWEGINYVCFTDPETTQPTQRTPTFGSSAR